jgi:electron transfer flavoprotein beta subunit
MFSAFPGAAQGGVLLAFRASPIRSLYFAVAMKILVCIKQVPQKDAPLRLNEKGTWIRDDVSWETNEPDAYALEEALRQKEKHGGEVAVITAGPARSQQVLREALAKGADRAIHLEDDRFAQMDAANTGLQSDDFGAAQTGVLLAEILGIPHATIIIGIEKSDAGLKLKRELEAGHYQHIEMPMPAVLTIQSGINKLRYATLIGIKQAKMKPLRKVAWAEVEAKLSKNMQRIERLYVPGSQKQTKKIQAPPAEAAKQLVEYLKNEARVV